MCPQTLHVEAPAPKVTVFGDRASKEVIRVIGCGPDLLGPVFAPCNSRRAHRTKTTCGRDKKAAVLQPGREAPLTPRPRTSASRLCETKHLLFKPRGLWYFVMIGSILLFQ